MRANKLQKLCNSITELMGFIFQGTEDLWMIKGFYKFLQILNKIRTDIFSILEK